VLNELALGLLSLYSSLLMHGNKVASSTLGPIVFSSFPNRPNGWGRRLFDIHRDEGNGSCLTARSRFS